MELNGKYLTDKSISTKKELYDEQKKTLDTFLSHGAISQKQYNDSLSALSEKMGFHE